MSRPQLKASSVPASGARATQKRQGDIIDAAAAVFAEKGFHGASTQDIADRLGIRQASLYYYFRSKEAALLTVCEKGVEGFYERARSVLAGKASAREKLTALIASHLLPLQDRADYMRVFLRERQHLPPKDRRAIAPLALGVEACFEDVIREGIRRREFSRSHDARLTTLAILGTLNAVPFWRDLDTRNIDKVAASLAVLLLEGLSGGATNKSRTGERTNG